MAWTSAPARDGATLEWHLETPTRIKAVVRMHKGVFYYAIAFGGHLGFGPGDYCTTRDKAEQRAEEMLREVVEKLGQFGLDHFGYCPSKGYDGAAK